MQTGTFPRYRAWRPTVLDPRGLAGDRNSIADFYVMPITRTRDSDCLADSNFEAFLKGLGGETAYVQVHRFAHWGPGWFEIILVSPTARATLRKADELASLLEDYPVLDESDFSQREADAADEAWGQLDMRGRIEECARRGIPIFAARRNHLPAEIDASGFLAP